MYSLNSNSRRITSYVREEAYKWLFERIQAKEYEEGMNRAAKQLFIDIRRAGRVTEETYNRFISLVILNPFDYILQSKRVKKKYITSPRIENFFVRYNGVALPIGFVKDFFEDDYETQAEIDKYISDVVSGQEEMFAVKCQEKLLNKSNQIMDLKSEVICVFHTKPLFHIFQLIKVFLTVMTMILCLDYLGNSDIIGKALTVIKERDPELMLRIITVFDIFNLFILLLLIPRIIKAIKTVIFYIRLLIIKIHVMIVSFSISRFEGASFDVLRDYFKSITPEIAKTHLIDEAICKSVPSVKGQYFAVMSFDFQKIITKIEKLFNSKRYAFLNAYYTASNEGMIAYKKKAWKKGIVFQSLLLIVICCTNVEACRDFIYNLYLMILSYVN